VNDDGFHVHHITQRDREALDEALSARAAFANGRANFRGSPFPITVLAGQLPEIWMNALRRYAVDGRLLYIVYSFQTPIAWEVRIPPNDETAWHVPHVRYSFTTSRHQRSIIAALTRLGEEILP